MSGPLHGLKVLDFSALLPGPYATLLLADLGADVLRVESPSRPDMVRLVPPFAHGVSTAHAYLNRNKRSISLDLKEPASIDEVKRLIADVDIVVEQFRPGVMERLGLGYEALAGVNARMIYCSITGYGQTGPLRLRAGHDLNYLALSGVAGTSGRAETGPPPFGVQVADLAGGSLHAAVGILAAVVERQRTGRGQHIDISMTDCVFALTALSAASELAGGETQKPENSMLNGGTFYDYYRTRDGRHLAVGSLEPQFLHAVGAATQCSDLVPLALSPNAADRARFKSTLTEVFAREDFATWIERFAALDCCVEPVLTLSEAMASPLAESRGWVAQVPVGDGTMQPQPAMPIKFSGSQPEYRFSGR